MLNVHNVHKRLGAEEVDGLLYYLFKENDGADIQQSVLSLACLWFNETYRKDSSVFSSILDNVLFYDFVKDEEVKEAMYLAILEEIPMGSFFASYLAILMNQRLMVVTAHLVKSFGELSPNSQYSDYDYLTA